MASRHPLWEDRLDETGERSATRVGPPLDHGREILRTTPLDAEPDGPVHMPEDSLLPLVTALVILAGFAALLAHHWWLALAALVATALCTLVWLTPPRPATLRAP